MCLLFPHSLMKVSFYCVDIMTVIYFPLFNLVRVMPFLFHSFRSLFFLFSFFLSFHSAGETFRAIPLAVVDFCIPSLNGVAVLVLLALAPSSPANPIYNGSP